MIKSISFSFHKIKGIEMKGLAVSFPFSGAILVRAASVLPTAQVTYSHTVTSPTLTCHTGTLPTATLVSRLYQYIILHFYLLELLKIVT